MDWIEEFNQRAAAKEHAHLIEAELKLYNIRVLEAQALDAWHLLVGQIKKDCAQCARCRSASDFGDYSLVLSGFGTPLWSSKIEFLTPPPHLRVRDSYSLDGGLTFTEVPPVRKIRLRLRDEIDLTFIMTGPDGMPEECSRIDVVSQRLISGILRDKF